jgi:uncharacterized protein (DUF2141 family)
MHKITRLGFAAGLLVSLAAVMPGIAFADSLNINFESPTYTLGNINAKNGWSALGSAGSGCAVYDEAVSSSNSTAGFGAQSLRISDAVTSGCFGDNAFSPSLANEAGETAAINSGLSGGVRQAHFEAQFSIASAQPGVVSGTSMSVSPDRGDGARMSYLRFEDQANGIHVFFDDYTNHNFNEIDIATLDRTVPHTVKFSMDFVNGPNNDVVKIYIDGVLKATGTSWEGYFADSQPTIAPPTVDSLLFRVGGTAHPANAGKGYFIDNLTLMSGPAAGSLVVTKNSVGGPATFSFSGDNGIGAFSIATVGTAASATGAKTVANLAAGTYHVSENALAGWTMTDNTCATVTVVAGATAQCTVTNVKNTLLGSINGAVLEDLNGDGKLSMLISPKMAGVTVYLDTNNNAQLDSGEKSTVTSAGGTYSFTSLLAGTYRVREVVPVGYGQTVPAGGALSVVLAAGATSNNNFLGNFKPGTVSGFVFNDLNGNGFKDANEAGLPGWTVKMYKAFTNVTVSTVSAADGSYSFTGVQASLYTLSTVAQSGWKPTTLPGVALIVSGANVKINFGNKR